MAPSPGTGAMKRGAPNSSNHNPDKRRRLELDKMMFTKATSENLNEQSFAKTREAEIKTLEKAMELAKSRMSTRAHQGLPIELRRRLGSHDPKRVPIRLRRMARKEMEEDNTPIRKKAMTGRMRLRQKTAERLIKLATQSKRPKTGVTTRKPRVKEAVLAEPPPPPKKFKKRQIHKTWLPTHLWHTKRAHITEARDPLWRFAIPLSPTLKSYRPTHRSSTLRGAVAWDMSYMSTVGLRGAQRSMEGLLKALGIGADGDPEDLWGMRGRKWRDGLRSWEGWMFERQEWPKKTIAPATIIWCVDERVAHKATASNPHAIGIQQHKNASKREVLIRVHPAGFHQLWEQLIRLAKVQKPEVSVEDLRFEIGSIDITGPSSTEALVSILHPIDVDGQQQHSQGVQKIWQSLAGLTNCSTLPRNAVIALDCADPRLRHPPRKPTVSLDAETQSNLIKVASDWPVDSILSRPSLFSRKLRAAATRSLSTQKAINRRKQDAKDKEYPESRTTDPRIPVLLYTTRNSIPNGQGTWTVMLPWKCVLPVWYSLMYYPVATGGTIRFGGLQEKRQLAFESSQPWYPCDYLGSTAGNEWEIRQREKRKKEWEKMPKGKRVEWATLDLGGGRKGEIGDGWACDWERLIRGPPQNSVKGELEKAPEAHLLPPQLATKFLRSGVDKDIALIKGGLATVKVTLLSRGSPGECARIYRLPINNDGLRKEWTAQIPAELGTKKTPKAPYRPSKLDNNAPAHLHKARQAFILLHPPDPPKPGESTYPLVPDEDDLIGYVTTGSFNLSEGRVTAMGSLLLEKALPRQSGNGQSKKKGREDNLCIVRQAGEKIGRLARWEIA